jgi:hypothetical protein
MSLGPRYTCPVCDGFVGWPAARLTKGRCTCPPPIYDRMADDPEPILNLTAEKLSDPLKRRAA